MPDHTEDLFEMELADPLALAPVPPSVARFFRSAADSGSAGVSPDLPAAGARDNQIDIRTLVIGRDMSLSGEITSCDRLIVEGSVEAELQNCKNLMISTTGVFKGSSSTENADVHGRFEGDLVVGNRLLIRAGGQVSGTITYGEIEIEAGGEISGELKSMLMS
jgi:cytoskeletal protein CcmA (bactofilin family)